MNIEQLLESHLEECTTIYIDTFNSAPWYDKWDEQTAYKRLLDIYNTPGFCGLVVIEENKIKAAVFGNMEQWYEGYMYNLKEMFVKHDEKRTGIGSKLMKTLENVIKEKGATSMTLFTSKGDSTETFYRMNGLEVEDDMIMMCKAL